MGLTCVPAPLDLPEAVERHFATGRRSLDVLEPSMTDARHHSEQITAADLVGDDAGEMDGQCRAELRGLGHHRALERRLRRPTIDQARHRLVDSARPGERSTFTTAINGKRSWDADRTQGPQDPEVPVQGVSGS
jgi:hypothetical protein